MQVCQDMHRRGLYLDRDTARVLMSRYSQKQKKAVQELADIVQGYLQEADYSTASKCPFRNGASFNPNSSIHVQYLLKNILKLDIGKSVDKNVLAEINLPVTKKILEVRGLVKLISTYIEKLPKSTTADGKVHATFLSTGADTGRFSSKDPNMQNIPSHAGDIRHLFRATPKQTKLIDAVELESEIHVELDLNDCVTTVDGLTKVNSLLEGNKLFMLKDSKPVMCIVTEIQHNASSCVIIMKEVV